MSDNVKTCQKLQKVYGTLISHNKKLLPKKGSHRGLITEGKRVLIDIIDKGNTLIIILYISVKNSHNKTKLLQ